MRVLVVGDNPQAASHCRALTLAGFEPDVSSTEACSAVVLVCDRPQCNGDCALRNYRLSAAGCQPVLVIAAYRAHDAPNRCLDAGADDFLTQPYRNSDLQVRLRAMIRRTSARSAVAAREQSAAPRLTRLPRESAPVTSLQVGDLTLDPFLCKAYRGGRGIDLALYEMRVLVLLMRHALARPGEVCPRKLLLEQVWDCRDRSKINSLKEHIKRLRKKLEVGDETKPSPTRRDPSVRSQLIHTERGKGYKLKA